LTTTHIAIFNVPTFDCPTRKKRKEPEQRQKQKRKKSTPKHYLVRSDNLPMNQREIDAQTKKKIDRSLGWSMDCQ